MSRLCYELPPVEDDLAALQGELRIEQRRLAALIRSKQDPDRIAMAQERISDIHHMIRTITPPPAKSAEPGHSIDTPSGEEE